MVKVTYDCIKCGEEITIKRSDCNDWGDGFTEDKICPEITDGITLTFI